MVGPEVLAALAAGAPGRDARRAAAVSRAGRRVARRRGRRRPGRPAARPAAGAAARRRGRASSAVVAGRRVRGRLQPALLGVRTSGRRRRGRCRPTRSGPPPAMPTGTPLVRVDTGAVGRPGRARCPGSSAVAVTRGWPGTLRDHGHRAATPSPSSRGPAAIAGRRDGVLFDTVTAAARPACCRSTWPTPGPGAGDHGGAGRGRPRCRRGCVARSRCGAPTPSEVTLTLPTAGRSLGRPRTAERPRWPRARPIAAAARPGRTIDVSTPAVVLR